MKAKVRSLLAGGTALDDDQLAEKLKVARQQVNQVCRELAGEGIVVRTADGPRGKIVNRLSAMAPPPAPARIAMVRRAGRALLAEDDLKRILERHLLGQGWKVTVLWGRDRGIDLVATRQAEHLIVECKGEAPTPQMEGNYFLGALGELVQRMGVAEAQYALALPNNQRFRGLVDRLPRLARQRLRLGVFFVGADGIVEFNPPPEHAP